MKLLLVLCAVIALTTAAPEAGLKHDQEADFEHQQEAGLEEAQNTPLKKGIYFVGNRKVYRINTDGTYVRVSSGNWGKTTCMATYERNRIFVVFDTNLYELYENSYKKFGSGYFSASALVQLGPYMYTTRGNNKYSHLFRISIGASSANIQKWGSTGIYSLGLTTVPGGQYIIGAETRWTRINAKGDGITLNTGSCTAITTAPDGAIYAVTPEGAIHQIHPADGSVQKVVVNGDLFKGTRGIAWFVGHLYAIGKNGRFYKIDPKNGKATIQGNSRNWEVAGKMASINY